MKDEDSTFRELVSSSSLCFSTTLLFSFPFVQRAMGFALNNGVCSEYNFSNWASETFSSNADKSL